MPLACDRHALAERLWSKVTKGPGCWLWTGATVSGGYGHIGIGRRTTYRVPRLVWWLETGQDPGDLCVLHRCDVRGCCRPDHLFLGTKAENNADMAAKGRVQTAKARAASVARKWARTHCKRGHEITPENTKYTTTGWRYCLACHRLRARMFHARKRHHLSPN
jgi:hypothetical protein